MKIEENFRVAIIIAIVVAVVSIVPISSASDWEQFQKDKINIGWTTDWVNYQDALKIYNNNLNCCVGV